MTSIPEPISSDATPASDTPHVPPLSLDEPDADGLQSARAGFLGGGIIAVSVGQNGEREAYLDSGHRRDDVWSADELRALGLAALRAAATLDAA